MLFFISIFFFFFCSRIQIVLNNYNLCFLLNVINDINKSLVKNYWIVVYYYNRVSLLTNLTFVFSNQYYSNKKKKIYISIQANGI